MLGGLLYQKTGHSDGGISHAVAKPDAVITGWLYIALGSWTLLGIYINGIISDLKISRWMSSDLCDSGIIERAPPCILPNPCLASISTAPAPGHKVRTTR